MKRFILSLFFTLVAAAAYADATPPAFQTGVTLRAYKDAARERALETLIWYPTTANTKMAERENGKGLFVPTLEIPDAPLAQTPKSLPLVLLSHGDSGSKLNEAWLADELAKQGFAVAAVDHYGNTTDNTTFDSVLRVWERPLDLSFVLDQILADKDFGSRIDRNRIYAIGHSAGGTAVLQLVGGLMAHAQLKSPLGSCDAKNQYSFKACQELMSYNFKGLDKTKIDASYADPRIKKAIALDPGFYEWFTPKSLDALAGRAFVFVAGVESYPGQDLKAGKFAAHLGKDGATTIAQAQHFDFLPVCNPKPKARDVPLCRGGDRLAIHHEVMARVLSWFGAP